MSGGNESFNNAIVLMVDIITQKCYSLCRTLKLSEAMRPEVEDPLENPVGSGAEGARRCALNLSGKRTEQALG